MFVFWQGHLQAFFMGLLFFLSGVFAHRSLARRGPGPFLRERLIRLGLPALLYMLVIQPFMVYVLLGHPQIPDRPRLAVLYGRYLASGRVLSGNGPLWFALALLVFCAALAAWRMLRKSPEPSAQPTVAPPGVTTLLGFGAVLVLTTFLVRLLQPVGTNVLNFQLCHFPRYIAAFAVGVAAGKHGWLESFVASRRTRIGGWLGFAGGPPLLALVVWCGGIPPDGGPNPYEGGWNPQAFGLAAWEQLAGLGISLGLLAFFHRRCDAASRLSTWLSERAFAVYVLHAPVLVVLTFGPRGLGTNPFLRAALLTVAGLAASFLVAGLAKRTPGLEKIL